MTPLADFVGAGSTQVINFPAGFAAAWVQFIVSGTGTVRLGGNAATGLATASLGLPLAAGAGMYTTPAAGFYAYKSGEFSAYIPSGATLSVGFKEISIPAGSAG
jgi:hypothetical protein